MVKFQLDTESDPLSRILVPQTELRRSAEGREALIKDQRISEAQAEGYRKRGRSKPPSKWDARHFIAWDGEGITDDNGRHRYVILANSEGDAIVNPTGVTTSEAFRVMLDCAESHPQAVHVIFAGGYDVNMILSGGSFGRHHAYILRDKGSVTLREDNRRYRITYHPRHTFEVVEEVYDEIKQRPVTIRRICLWDVFGSFQASFVKACNRTLEDNELTELTHIQDMKGKRGSFVADDIAEMLDYCRAELRALVKLQESDRDSFQAAGFKATRWDGAGAKASAVLRFKGVGDHKRELDDELRTPVRAGYAGGRIECVRFGHHSGPMHTVDIRSAYPWAATFLPSLSTGYWERVGNVGPKSGDEFSLWHVNYKGAVSDDIHPFFWRSPDGRICYPQMTEGWYWAPEVWAAQHHARGKLKIIDGWRFCTTSTERPFSFIPQLFEARKHLEASRKGRGWPLKLALNSLYGKLAQQIGGNDGKPPRWHQLEWAGWITSKCRATMYAIVAPNYGDVVSIQTDGITFRGSSVCDDVLSNEGPNLGQFEVEHFDAGTFVQSGIYWLHDQDGWHDPKVRGVGADVLRRGDFEAQWPVGDWPYPWSPFGAVPVDVTRFRGMVTSSISARRWEDWCQWVTERREIASVPFGKRIHVETSCATCRTGATGLHDTLPTGGGSRSSLHVLAWDAKVGSSRSDEWWLDTLDTEDSTDE